MNISDTPTQLQKKAVEKVLEQKLAGKNINYKKALTEAGYSAAVAHNPNHVTNSRGYRMQLAKYDLTEDTVAGLMRADIDTLGAGERFVYVKLLAQMLGMLDPNVNLNVTQSDEGLEMIKNILAEPVKEELNGFVEGGTVEQAL